MTALASAVATIGAGTARAALPPARADIGVSAYPFELGQVRLTAFRLNHGLSTIGAAPCGGWEAPNFEFRSHSQGHFLSAWAQAWAVRGDTVCRDQWRFVPNGSRRIQNLASGLVLGVQDMSAANGSRVVQWDDNGTSDHLWRFV